MRTLPLTLAAALAALATGCAVEAVDGRFPPQTRLEADAALDTDGGPALDAGQPVLTDPTGQWLLFIEDRNCLFTVGNGVEALIWSWYLVDIEPTGPGRASLRQRTRMCHQELSPLTFGFLSIVPDEVPESAPDAEFEGFLAGSTAGSIYVSGTLTELWGAERVAADEALPASTEDPRVIDQDGDGSPGVTFPVQTPTGVEVCRVFVTQRMHHALGGAVVDGRRIEGTAETSIEKVVLAATTDLCASGDVIPNDAGNRFVLVRVDGTAGSPDADTDGDGAVECGELRGALATIMANYGIEQSEPDAQTWCNP